MKWISNIFSEANRKFLIYGTIIIIPILFIYIFLNQKTSEIKDTLKENKKIEAKIDSAKIYNKLISEKIALIELNQQSFKDIINKNNTLIEENNKELSKLKISYDAKINNANSFTVSQLNSFFTTRYKDLYGR